MNPLVVGPAGVTPMEVVAVVENVPSDNHKHCLDVENPKHWVPWVRLYSGVYKADIVLYTLTKSHN